MSRLTLLLGACLAVASPAFAAEKLADYTAQVPLKVEGQGPWYRLELPMALQLAAAHGDLRDLRVFNAEGEPLAYSLTRSEGSTARTEQALDLKWFPLRGPANVDSAPRVRVERSTTGTLVEVVPEEPAAPGERLRGWLLDASAAQGPLERLVLDWTTGEEGFQRFSIEASDDLQDWRPWGTGQLARLSFGGDRIDQREVALPGQPARYLRLLWLDAEAPVLSAARVTTASRESRPAPMVWSDPLPARSEGEGEYRWDLPLPIAVERLRFALEQPNTLAPVQLQSRNDPAGQWRPLTSGLLYRLPGEGKENVHDELILSGWDRIQQVRLKVDLRAGGFGTQGPALRVGMRATEVVFLARGTGPFVLAVGRPAATSSALPLGTLVPGLREDSLAKMGQARIEGDLRVTQAVAEEKTAVQAEQTDWKRFGLWAVLLLGVGLLVMMAVSLLRTQNKGA